MLVRLCPTVSGNGLFGCRLTPLMLSFNIFLEVGFGDFGFVDSAVFNFVFVDGSSYKSMTVPGFSPLLVAPLTLIYNTATLFFRSLFRLCSARSSASIFFACSRFENGRRLLSLLLPFKCCRFQPLR